MLREIEKKIKEYDHIALYRHINPDSDAFGSQLGMYAMITNTFKDKKVYVCGDFDNDVLENFEVEYSTDKVDYSKDVLGIVLDTANVARIDDQDYQKCKELIKIDHHIIVESYGDINYEDCNSSSACQLVVKLLMNTDFTISLEGAKALYLGIISDSNRFMYRGTDSETFKCAGYLVDMGIDLPKLYNKFYTRHECDLRVNKFILNNYVLDEGVAYYVLKDEDLKDLNIDRQRGSMFVNTLAGVEEFKVWMAITQNVVDNNYRVSIRSREVPINDIAEKFSGGGHMLASGATLQTIDELPSLVAALKERINE